MDSSRLEMLSCSFRTGINMDTRSSYCRFTLVSLGFEIKLKTVTVKRRIKKNNVMEITSTNLLIDEYLIVFPDRWLQSFVTRIEYFYFFIVVISGKDVVLFHIFFRQSIIKFAIIVDRINKIRMISANI